MRLRYTCFQFIKASELRIDPYFKKLLADVVHDEELEEVEILPDASWRRRITEDDSAPPPAKKVKTEQVEAEVTGTAFARETTVNGSASTGASAAMATTGSTDPGSSSAPFEIDLSLSSGEEDGDDAAPAPAASRTGQASQPTPAQSSSAGLGSSVLLDEDVAVLTVDSNVWDTNRSTTSNEMRLANALGLNSGGSTGNGANSDMFPFPLDDSIFASLAPNSNGGGNQSGSGSGSWNQMYGGMPYMSSSVPLSSSTYSSTSAAWNPPASSSGLMQHPEVDLASTMAMISQGTTPPRQLHSQIGRSLDPDPLDIICLLDSDSD